jgi:MFS family permease
VVFSLFGGVIVDRYPRLPIMIGSDLVRGLISLLLAFLAYSGNLLLWHVYVLSLIFGIIDSFFQPAFTATVPAIVPEPMLPSANSLTSFATQAGRILGPPLGAGLIALGGTSIAFLVNGLTFFASALFMLPLLWQEIRPIPSTAPQSLLTGFKEGLHTVRNLPWLWITIGLFALGNVALVGPYSVAMPFLVKDVLQADVNVLGLLYAMFAVGYVLGGVWLGRLPAIRRRGTLLYACQAVAGGTLLLFGLPIGLPVMIVAALINGAALEMAALSWTSMLQELVPRERLGRVSGVDTVGSLALVPIGFALTGLATEAWGAALVFVIGGGSMALLALLIMRHPAIRLVD